MDPLITAAIITVSGQGGAALLALLGIFVQKNYICRCKYCQESESESEDEPEPESVGNAEPEPESEGNAEPEVESEVNAEPEVESAVNAEPEPVETLTRSSLPRTRSTIISSPP